MQLVLSLLLLEKSRCHPSFKSYT